MSAPPLLEVRALRVSFPARAHGRNRRLRALEDVGFELARGETLGVVGESGSGKSTLARALLRLVAIDAGQIRFDGLDLLGLAPPELRATRRRLQMVFQDPIAALDPRQQIGEAIAEPLLSFRPDLAAPERRALSAQLLARVGLNPEYLERYPHELSGGQAQRAGIARALISGPELIVCDEPLSALDVSIKAQIANLLKDLQRELRLSLLLIAHDLAAVRFACDRVLVLYLGRIVEIGPSAAIFAAARHPYTRALLQAVPAPDPRAARTTVPVAGDAPSAFEVGPGCVFRHRCPHALERCAREVPALQSIAGVEVACHRAQELNPSLTRVSSTPG